MIQLKEITIELLASLLDDAAIDNRLDGEHRIYVTGLPFNFWLRIEHDRSNLVFSTYRTFRKDVSEVEMLRCANTLVCPGGQDCVQGVCEDSPCGEGSEGR